MIILYMWLIEISLKALKYIFKMSQITVIKNVNYLKHSLFCRVFLQGSWSECPIWTMCSRTLLPLWGCVPKT